MLENALFWSLLIVYEVIFVEQVIIISSLERKNKLWVIIASIVLITVALTLIAVFYLSSAENFGDGGGSNLFLGALFIIPGFLCFKGTPFRKLIINFASFTYGLGVLAISIRIGYCVPKTFFYLTVFITQTVLHIIALPVILRYSKDKLVVMLSNLTKKLEATLLQSCIVSFILVIMINSAITRDTSAFQKAVVVILLFYLVLITYKLMVDYNDEVKRNESLYNLASTNAVTEMPNSTLFYKKLGDLRDAKEVFNIVYIDLDSFKIINDTYGHLKGDEYLFQFGKILKSLGSELVYCYHLSGDEFALICKLSIEETITMINQIQIEELSDMSFLGLSYGLSSYPKDGESVKEVLTIADKNMYEVKKQKNVDRQSRR